MPDEKQNVGFGQLGLLNRPLKRYIDIALESASEKITIADFRPCKEVSDWAAFDIASATYSIPFDEKDRRNQRFDVVELIAKDDQELTRVESEDECKATAGSFYYDPEDTKQATHKWDDGVSKWDDGILKWDQYNALLVHLSDGSNPNLQTTVVVTSVLVGSKSEVHPSLSLDKMASENLDGGFEDWISETDLTKWIESSPKAGTHIISRISGLESDSTYAVKLEGTQLAASVYSASGSYPDLIPGAMYRITGLYQTSNAYQYPPKIGLYSPTGTLGYLDDDGRTERSSHFQTLDETYGETFEFCFDFIVPDSWTTDDVQIHLQGYFGYVIFDSIRLFRIWRWERVLPRLSSTSVPTSRAGARDLFFGGKEVGIGGLALLNNDGYFDKLLADWIWTNRDVRIWQTGGFLQETDNGYKQSLLRHQWHQAFTGLIQGWKAKDTEIEFTLHDIRETFHSELPTRFYDDAVFPYLDQNFLGVPRAIFFGSKSNITPIGIDKDSSTGYRIYEFADPYRTPNGFKAVDNIFSYANTTAAKERDSTRRITLIGPSLYTPDEIPGANLTGWWNADTITGLSSGDNLQTWEDQSGNGRDFAQATEADRPSWHTNIINSHAAVRFDQGNTEFLDTTATLGDFINADTGTIFVVFKPIALDTDDATITNNEVLWMDLSASPAGVYMRSSGPIYSRNYDGDEDAASDSGLDTNTHLHMWKHRFGNVWSGLDEVRESQLIADTSGDTSTLTGALRLGRNGSIYSDIYITEIIAYDTALNDDQCAFVEAYLANKYGLTPSASAPVDYSEDLANGQISIQQDVQVIEITADNNKLDFSDGSTKVATITTGLYTPNTLCAEIEKQLLSGSSLWSCNYSNSTHKITIARDSGTASLLCNTGSNKEIGIWSTIEFSTDSDKTGSTSYESDAVLFDDESDTKHILRMNAKGIKDDASGTYTGAANALVEIGADICQVFVHKYLRRPYSSINQASFIDARGKAPESCTIYLNSQISTKEIFEQLEFSNIANITIGGDGSIYYEVYVGEVSDDAIVLYDRDYIEFSIEKSTIDVYETCRVLYDKDPSNGDFEARSSSDEDVGFIHNRPETKEFETYLKIGDNASAASRRLLELAKVPARTVKVKVKGKLLNHRPGQKIILNRSRAIDPNGRFNSAVFRIISISHNYQSGETEAVLVDDVITVAGIACIASCQSLCEGICQDACQAICQALCQEVCQTSCETTCQDSCQNSCQDSCQTSCQETCELVCQDACQSSCQDACEASCQGGACEYGCQTSCQLSCQDACQSACQNPCQSVCQSSCQSGCQEICEASCQSTCEQSCQGCGETTCQKTCESNCQLSCELFCQEDCQFICETPSEQLP